MKRTCLLSLIGILGLLSSLSAQVRTEMLLEKGWKFSREDKPEAIQVAFDDSQWQSVTVPHDWAIYGPFSSQNDKQNVAITQDGQKEAMEHAGRTGGLPFVGVGWYRNTLEVPAFKAGKKAFILFDGAMSHAEVYINGKAAENVRYHLLLECGREEYDCCPVGEPAGIVPLVSGCRIVS